MMSQQIPVEVRERIDRMTEAFGEQLEAMYVWSNETRSQEGPLAMQIEDKIRQWIRQIGADTQALLLEGMDHNRRKGKAPCPHCGEQVYWHNYEPRQYITSLGEMQIERAYYNHGVCHRGWVPLDERLGLGASELSPFVQEMASYLGAFMPFGRAQDYLSRYQGIHISHDLVNDTTVMAGQALKEKQEQEIRRVWATSELPACEAKTPPKRLYVSADGITYLLPDGQGSEIKVAAVYETEERRNKKGETEIHAVDIEYIVATDPETLARAASLTAVKRGAEWAEEIIVLGDGASWIWNRITPMFPKQKVTEVVDFYHASGYIWDACNAVWGQETEQAKLWCQMTIRFAHWRQLEMPMAKP